MKNAQLRPGQDVLYVQSNNEVTPGKLIQQSPESEGWNVILFTKDGVRNVKNILYNDNQTPNTFHLQEEAEHSRAAGASSR